MTVNIITEPRVRVITRQVIDPDALADFLSTEAGAPGWGSDAAKDAEAIPEIAGRLCYSSYAKPRPGGNAAYLRHILESGHGNVLEHTVFGLLVTGVSRTLTHELIRHRAGMSYSEASQRFIDCSDVAFVVPPAMLRYHADWLTHGGGSTDPESLALAKPFGDWLDRRREDLEEYEEWVERLVADAERRVPCPACGGAGHFTRQNEGGGTSWSACRSCFGGDPHGTVPLVEKGTDRRKWARQAARSVLPGCAETRVFVTGNVRALRSFLEQRGSRHADAEIRRLAFRIWSALLAEAPGLFSDYSWSSLPDGSMGDPSTPWRKV